VPRFRRLQPDAADPFARTCKDATFISERRQTSRVRAKGQRCNGKASNTLLTLLAAAAAIPC
jgi:hypothetical protein